MGNFLDNVEYFDPTVAYDVLLMLRDDYQISVPIVQGDRTREVGQGFLPAGQPSTVSIQRNRADADLTHGPR